MISFLEFFSGINSHMFLIPMDDSETSYSLVPPNQMDWNFTLTKVSDTEWVVDAFRLEDFGISSTEYSQIYKYVDDSWVCYEQLASTT